LSFTNHFSPGWEEQAVMIVEKATLEHLERVCMIDSIVIGNQSRRDYLNKSIESSDLIIAKINDEIAGYSVYDRSFFGYSYISLIIVDPVFRRKGVATGLIQYIEKNIPDAKLFTSTNESNVAMQKVCESLGFRRSGIIENLDEGDPEFIYFKLLK
jgi:ribosomal protein S18 acetylase RimI-like enzyme